MLKVCEAKRVGMTERENCRVQGAENDFAVGECGLCSFWEKNGCIAKSSSFPFRLVYTLLSDLFWAITMDSATPAKDAVTSDG